jgi:hypothetical protein
LVLDSGTSAATAAVVYSVPSPIYAELNMTPPPAAPPVSARVFRAEHHLTVRKLRAAYAKQVRTATRDLKAAIRADIAQLNASGTAPTAQQMADFQASVAGALDATALRLSTQASLLPNSAAQLVPAIQNGILGSSSTSLASRLTALMNSGQLAGSARSLTQVLNSANRQAISQINSFFNTTPVNSLSVNSSGQHIPLAQFLGG